MTDEQPAGQLWEMGIYGAVRQETGVTHVGVQCDLTPHEVAQLPVGTTIQMTVAYRKREVTEQ